MLQAVADQQHGAAAAQHAARPVLVEIMQAGGDAGAARPVGHRAHHLGHGDVGVAALQQPGGARQPGAEDKALHRRIGMAQRMGEVQQHARVAAHRARDVGQHHQRCRLDARRAPAHVPQLAAVAGHGGQRGAPVGHARAVGAALAPGGQRLEHQPQLGQQALGLAPFVGRHGVEIGLAQAPRGRSRSGRRGSRSALARARPACAAAGAGTAPRPGGGSRAAAARHRLSACTLGSSRARMRPIRSGSRQNSTKAWSKSSRCSMRSIRQA